MLPRKTGKPIAFKCTEELRQQTEAIADSLGQSLSDYVRIAVETYNRNYQRTIEKVNAIPDIEKKIIQQEQNEFKTFFKK